MHRGPCQYARKQMCWKYIMSWTMWTGDDEVYQKGSSVFFLKISQHASCGSFHDHPNGKIGKDAAESNESFERSKATECKQCNRMWQACSAEYLNFTKAPRRAKDGVPVVFSAIKQDRLRRSFSRFVVEKQPKLELGVRANKGRYVAAASIWFHVLPN